MLRYLARVAGQANVREIVQEKDMERMHGDALYKFTKAQLQQLDEIRRELYAAFEQICASRSKVRPREALSRACLRLFARASADPVLQEFRKAATQAAGAAPAQ